LSEAVYLSFRAALSFLPLILFAVILTAARCMLASHSLSLPAGTDKLSVVFQQLLVATWVYFDRQGRDLGLPFEFDAFVFFAWPIALPYYLVKSRGSRGLLLFAVFFALLVVPAVIAQAVRLLR
jgi:hypothetical protein